MPLMLIADDSMFQRFQAAKTAREAGFTVIEARDGAECLRLAREQGPEVLLLDLNMPDPGGLEVLEALSREIPDLAVVVVTADIQETTRQRCLELGARCFLNKPVDAAALGKVLASLAGGVGEGAP